MPRPPIWLAIVLLVLGVVWVGQGIGVIPGSFMTGSRFWAAVGLVLIGVSVAIFVRELRATTGR